MSHIIVHYPFGIVCIQCGKNKFDGVCRGSHLIGPMGYCSKCGRHPNQNMSHICYGSHQLAKYHFGVICIKCGQHVSKLTSPVCNGNHLIGLDAVCNGCGHKFCFFQ